MDSVIVELHAELNALVEHLLRLVRSILVDESQRLHVLMVVTEGCLDYSVSDGFGYDLLGLHV